MFIRHLEQSGWPPAGRLANSDVFDKMIAPKLQESGRRLLYFSSMPCAMAWVELEKQLVDDGQVEINAAFAQLPSITPVGMASLLPGAGSELKLLRKEDQVVVALGDQPLPQVTQRMDVLKKRFGDRFAEMSLTEFVRGKGKVDGGVELFVLRSTTIDQHMESTPEMALRLIHESLKSIRVAIHKLRGGFKDAFVVPTMGFISTRPRLVTCVQTAGNGSTSTNVFWVTGFPIHSSFQPTSGHPGISTSCGLCAMVPIVLASGTSMGALPCRAVVPVIAVRMQEPEGKFVPQAKITLNYKRGAQDHDAPARNRDFGDSADLFSMSATFEILVEATTNKAMLLARSSWVAWSAPLHAPCQSSRAKHCCYFANGP